MPTNDHTVPQMYLRRFAKQRRGKHFIAATPVDNFDRGFTSVVRKTGTVKGFYWASLPDGTDHHEVETLLSRIEGAAVPAFEAMLDAPEGALPERWPMPPAQRTAMAWWLAAQILRTTRQRLRLTHQEGEDLLDAPTTVGRFAANNAHLSYLVNELARLAAVLFQQPWCLGFSDACLLTSDVPVLLLNGQDDPAQDFAAWYDAVYLPLDPHRFLLLPDQHQLAEDPRKQRDHRMKGHPGTGLFFNDAIWSAADRQLFHHPDHNPLPHLTHTDPRARLPHPGSGDEPPRYVFDYEVLPPHLTVDRRWINEHPPPRALGRPV